MNRNEITMNALLLATLAVFGCDRTSGGDPHDHGDEHDHGDSGAGHEHEDEVTLTQDAIERHGIRIASVEERVLTPVLRVAAQVAFDRERMAHVGSPMRGRVASVEVKLGDEVKKGQPLFVIESPELGEAKSEYLAKRAAVDTARPAVDLAKDSHQRARDLFEKSQGIALTEVQKRELELRTAEAVLQAAQSAERVARDRLRLFGVGEDDIAQLEKTAKVDARFTVVAPIGGQVIDREATLGESVGPEREHLLLIADLAHLWVLASVPEASLREVVVGAPARVLLGTERDHWCSGAVAHISPIVDPRTRSATVRIEATDRHAELRPGVFAEAEIDRSSGSPEAPRATVPQSALQTIDGASVVFVPVPNEPGTFAVRPVTTGAAIGGFVPILAGLKAGDPVVVENAFLLKAELGKSSAEHGH